MALSDLSPSTFGARLDQMNVDAMREKLYQVGICPDCFEEMVHSLDEPFSDCSCGTHEDCSGPSVLQKLRIENARLREMISALPSL